MTSCWRGSIARVPHAAKVGVAVPHAVKVGVRGAPCLAFETWVTVRDMGDGQPEFKPSEYSRRRPRAAGQR